MFNETIQTRIKSSKSKEEVYDTVEIHLEMLGITTVDQAGNIHIDASRAEGFSYKSSYEGKIRARNGEYLITLDYTAKPDVTAWILGICFFPIGFALFVLPYVSSQEVLKKGTQLMYDIEYELSENA